jgi:hypothetical protein
MNLRIQELKKQAMVEVRSHGAFGEVECYKTLDEDKFAELIVRECINKVNEVGYKSANNISTDDTELFKNVLKSHFGVEE